VARITIGSLREFRGRIVPTMQVPSQAPVAQSSAPAASPAGTFGEVVEYILRLVFFAFVPALVVIIAELVPMTAALINMVLALAAFFLGEILHKHAEKRGWLGRVLRRQLAFEAYYRQHPPKPFAYYLFYPLAAPYWIFVKEGRREFLLFKGYTLLTLGVVVLSGIYRLIFVYGPTLGLKDFVAPFLVGLVIETLSVIMLLMPMTTSVVALHQKKQHARLSILLFVGLLSSGIAVARVIHRHRTFPSLETRYRVKQRTAAGPGRARDAGTAALRVAWKKRREGAWGREDDGLLAGPALEDARAALEVFYRPDEAAAFEIYTTSKTDKSPIMILYAEGARKGHPVWMGMRPDGTTTERAKDIPKPALKLMRTVGTDF
jgi:hypothetical protein